MSRIDEMVARLAPSGVPHLPLGDVGAFVRGSGLQKSDLRDQGIPAIHYGQIHTYYRVWADETKSFVDPALANRLKKASTGDLVIATTSEDDAAVGKATAWLGDSDAAVSGDAYIYHHSLDPKYVAYYFQSDGFQSQKVRFISGTKVRRISGDSLSKITIPVPPLEAQQEIVRILDKFTQLEAELEAELEARLLQYAYYRDDLLSFDASVPRLTLGDLGAFFGGLSGKTKADFAGGNARFASYRNVFSNPALDVEANDFVQVGETEFQRSLQLGDVILTGSSESFEEVGMSSVVTREPIGKMYLNSFSIGFRLNNPDILDPVYSKHLFRSRLLRKQIIKAANGVTRINLSKKLLSRVVVPVPSLDVQKRVGETLESFSSLIHDMEIGLPAEIAARRKQYEYYRDKLLTFEEAS